MKKIILILILLSFPLTVQAENKKIADYSGSYSLAEEKIADIENSTEYESPSAGALNPELIIQPDGDIIWGGGKKHSLRLRKDFDDSGRADFTEDFTIDNQRFVTHYTLEISAKYLILYSKPARGKFIKYYFETVK